MRRLARPVSVVRSSLKLKLILFVVVILGLTVGIAPWSAIRAQKRQLLEDAQAHLQSLQQTLKALVETSMLMEDREQVQRVVELVSGHEEIKLVRIFGTDGVIHFSSHREERGVRLSAEEMQRLREAGHPVVLTRELDAMTHTLLEPLFNRPPCFSCHGSEQKVLGILQLSLSLAEVSGRIADLRRSALVSTLVTLGVVVVGLWLALTLLIDHPLQRLVETMVQVESGDLSVRAAVPSPDEIGQLSGHFNRMVAQLSVAQGELEQYHREQMVRADRLATIGQMAAAIAHEIRNPLTGISGALSVLSRGFAEDDPRRDIVRQTRLLIDRLNKTVEDILDYSRPSLPHVQVVEVDGVVDHSVSLVEGEAKKAGIRVVKTGGAADSGESPLCVSVDPQQMQQVLMNLILNAIQASSAGEEVRVRTRRTGSHGGQSWACVEIQDHGKGMTAEEVSKAFQPFFSTKAHGTGLGLPIARQIIEQHNGRIAIQSAPGQGTRIEVGLPAHELAVPGSLIA